MSQFLRPAHIIARMIIIAALFIPQLQSPVERDPELDIELVRAAEVRYRGITGNFEELTRAYALTAFTDAELLGWEARANPQQPESEALVTCRFRVSSVQTEADTIAQAHALRASVDGELAVTWQLSTLSSVQVTPADDFARDAISTLRHTIDDYLASMVLLIEDLPLRSAAGLTDSIGIARQGEILLRQAQDRGWSRVRVPAENITGWLPDSVLTQVSPR
jgi:hypothetical protein